MLLERVSNLPLSVREDAYVLKNQLQRFRESPSWTSLRLVGDSGVGNLMAVLIEIEQRVQLRLPLADMRFKILP